jgi:hypothetical protein
MNCFIKKGSGTWYTFIACPSCYFAYGENAGSMREVTSGIVGGAEVWYSLIVARDIDSIEQIHAWIEEENQYTVSTPFEFPQEDEHWLNTCVLSEDLLKILVEAWTELNR